MNLSQNNIQILHLTVANLTLDELLANLERMAHTPDVSIVNYANAHGCNLSYTDRTFRKAMEASDLIFCDGNGVKLGAKILGKPLNERMTPPDWIDRFFRRCVEIEASVYFVGETMNDCTRFYEAVQKKHPNLTLAGYHHGYFEFDTDEEVKLVEELTRLRPHFIVTGMGMPKQEIWAARMKDRIQSSVFLSTGALFIWYAGLDKRERNFLTDHGFEWLLRYFRHPVTLFKRYILGNPLFIFRVIKQRFGQMI